MYSGGQRDINQRIVGSLCARDCKGVSNQYVEMGNLFMEFKIIENHPNDSRVIYKEDGVFQTLSSRMGTGGGQRADGSHDSWKYNWQRR